jgi:uncharacterized protein
MINLVLLPDEYSIYQLSDNQKIPIEIFDADFYSITRTGEEISIVTSGKIESANVIANTGWKGFKVDGKLEFSLVGIINEITGPLKDNQISVFVISTFNTDYVFVKKESFDRVIEIFKSTKNIGIKYL